MADRYWVGGSGTWDATSTTNWSDTSGGAGGASAPTAVDDVYFDSSSSASSYTVTVNCNVVATGSVSGSVLTITAITSGSFAVGQRIYVALSRFLGGMTTAVISSFGTGTGGTGTYNLDISLPYANSRTILGGIAVCRSITVTAPSSGSITMAGSRPLLTYGDINYPATGLTVNFSGDYGLWASDTRTIATNNIMLTTARAVVIGTGTYNLASALTVGGDIFIQRGELNSNNYNITATTIARESSTYGTGNFNPGSSVLTLSTGIELNTGTSFQDATVTITGAYPNIVNGTLSKPVKNVNLTNSSSSSLYTYGSPLRVTGKFYIAPKTNLSIGSLGGNANVRVPITIDGEFECVQPDNRLYQFELNDLVLNGVVNLKNVVFRTTNVTGASAPISGINLGDAGGNTGVIFPSPKTVYWNLSGSQDWLSNGWASTSGGTPSLANFPLPQDTCIFDDAGSAGTITVSSNNFYLPAISFTNRTIPLTFTVSSNKVYYCGNTAFSAAVTLTGTNPWVFRTFTTLQLTSAGKTIPTSVQVESGPTGVVQLQDALTTSSSFTLTQGTIDLNNFNLTTSSFSSTGSPTRRLNVGTGTLTITGASFTVSGSNHTTTGTGTISMTSGSSKTFAGGGFSYPILNQGGTGELIITGTNTFARISNSVYGSTITFPNVTTTVSDWKVFGILGSPTTIQRTGASGTFTLNYTGSSKIQSDYLTISNSTVTPSNTWFAGTRSTDAGGNSGWSFTFTNGNRYWVGGTGTWDATSTTNWAVFSGGTGGVPSPTILDDVYFDSNSATSSYNVTLSSGFVGTGSISGNTLTITGVTSGALQVGSRINFNINNTFINNTDQTNLTITQILTGSGGIGTYQLNSTTSTSSRTIFGDCPICNNRASLGPLSGTLNFLGTSPLTLNGNLIDSATSVSNDNYTSQINFVSSSTQQISFARTNANGGCLAFYNTGTRILLSSLNIAFLYIDSGTFDTDNYNITPQGVFFGARQKSIYLKNSQLYIRGSYAIWVAVATNTIFDAGTSTINILGGSGVHDDAGFITDDLNYYNINIIPNYQYDSSVGINGNINAVNFTIDNTNTEYINFIFFNRGNPISVNVSNLFKARGKGIIPRIRLTNRRFTTNTYTIQPVNITAGQYDIDNADIQGCNITNTTLTGTSLGDCGNNSGITFTPPKTVYWNNLSTSNISWKSTISPSWALSPTGTPSVDNYPLPQDTAIFTDAGISTNANFGLFNVGQGILFPNVDMSALTKSVTFHYRLQSAAGSMTSCFGSFLFSNSVSINNDRAFTFMPKNDSVIDFKNKSIHSISFESTSGNITLGGGYTSLNSTSLIRGVLNTNNYPITTSTFSSSTSYTRTLNLQSSTITLTGTGTAWDTSTSTALTLLASNSTIVLQNAGNQTFAGGGLVYGKLKVKNP